MIETVIAKVILNIIATLCAFFMFSGIILWFKEMDFIVGAAGFDWRRLALWGMLLLVIVGIWN